MADTLLTTADGSHTLMSGAFGVTYHSTHGAIQESNHVFVEAGMQYLYNAGTCTFNILEMGLGTGLNALLAFQFALTYNCRVKYTAYEKYPLAQHQWQALNYCSILRLEPVIMDMIHEAKPFSALSPLFTIEVIHTGFEEAVFPRDEYNLVFFDAFDPVAQPELWTTEVFSRVYIACSHAVLVTYSAKGQVRRNLQLVGFKTERLPGPPGKREMLRAVK